MQKLLMQKGTAVWLIDNTSLTFRQIAQFCNLHELEVQGIADGEVAVGIRGDDPVAKNQLDMEEIERGQNDPSHILQIKANPAAVGEQVRKGPRYTPLSKRQDRPAAVLWLIKKHPELNDATICRLVGTTKQTIGTIRDRTHWNMSAIQPTDPVALGLCTQIDLDTAVAKASRQKAKAQADQEPPEPAETIPPPPREERRTDIKVPSAISGLEDFRLTDGDG